MILQKLGPLVPGLPAEQRAFFDVYVHGEGARPGDHDRRMAQNLRKALLFSSGVMPMGLLRDCLDDALNDNARLGGVFEAVKAAFRFSGGRKLLEDIVAVYDFRNTHVAHQERAIADVKPAGAAMGRWIGLLASLSQMVKPDRPAPQRAG